MGLERGAPLPEKFARRARRVNAQHDDSISSPPLTRDTPLTVPLEEWEKSDREGTCGNGRRFFLGPPSERYKKRYEQIDWSS